MSTRSPSPRSATVRSDGWRTRVSDAGKRRVNWVLRHGVTRAALRLQARKGDLQARFILAGAGGADTTTAVEEVRAAGAMVGGRLGYATVRHDLCRQVLTSASFRTGVPTARTEGVARMIERTAAPGLHPLREPSLLVTEAPDHTRMRKLTTRVFTGRATARLAERTERIADDLLADLSGDVDVVEAYCSWLPVAVISDILGVPHQARERVLELGTAVAASLDLGTSWAESQSVTDGLIDFSGWMADHLDWLRAHPGDNLLSHLVQAADAEGQLSETELVATAGLILAAGFETTVNLLSNGIRLLLDHPDQLALLRADPSLWSNAVEEVLRLDPPVLMTGRQATESVEVGGTTVQRGVFVTAIIAGANRDPEVFTDPHTFDVTRPNAAQHLSFSAGRHHCLGAALARMEGEVGLRAFFDHYAEIEQLPGARRRTTRILRGWETLPLRLVPARSSVTS